MKRAFLIAVVILVAYAQMSFFGAWRPFGVIPNLFMVLIIYMGLMRPASETVAMAMLGGFLLDTSSGANFGLNMAYYGLLALLVIISKRVGADLDKLGLVLGYIVGATLLYNVAVLLGVALDHDTLPFGVLGARIGIEMVLNMMVAVVVRYPLVHWLKPRTNLPEFGSRRSLVL